jgi:maltooligosyltrehalose trehalohydrolase
VEPGGGVRFRVWAPGAGSLSIKLEDPGERRVPMARSEDGVFEITVHEIGAGTDYRYVFEGGRERPDPISRWQPNGVHGASRVVDAEEFGWSDQSWKGIPLENLITYEIHVGTFTPEGTFEAIIPRLPDLLNLGVTAIELMPVAEFPGARNWGYDGVSLFAPHSAYGGPTGLKRLVDACHGQGLAVILDVVYNHLGPEGNYLGDFGPYLSDRHDTPWGPALNLDGGDCVPVRRFVVDNALYWQSEYHMDGLRLDAIHGFDDTSDRHILDSQWSNDFHHSLHASLLGSRHGYFGDFGRLEDLGRALSHGFVYQGQYSAYRGRDHGRPPIGVDGRRFVVFIQNHDQVANPYGGARLSTLAWPEQQKLAAAILFCAPSLPLLFMGEEYAEDAPFLFFTSHSDPSIIESTRQGREREHSYSISHGNWPDPQDMETFRRSKPNWEIRQEGKHGEMLACYRDLIALRSNAACLAEYRREASQVWHDEGQRWLVLLRSAAGGEAGLLICNFAENQNGIPLPPLDGSWRLGLWTGDPRYGGPLDREPPRGEIRPTSDSMTGISLAAHSAALYFRDRA